ncbi:MAG: hypothetical protein KDA93_01595 [Planctomycetaceae bacterium]|nr:hypothetical protein [Planctomycetaceae bacterium]
MTWNDFNLIPLVEKTVVFVERGDLCALSFALLILLTIGSKAVESRPDLSRFGLWLALAAFVLWMLRSLGLDGVMTAEQLVSVSVRGVAFAASVLAAAWLLLPLGAALADHLLFAPGQSCFSAWRRWRRLVSQRLAELSRAHDESRRQSAWHANSDQREEAAREAAREKRRRELQQRRRDEVRLELRLLYDRHRVELQSRLPPEQVQTYFDRFLTDELSPTLFARRAEKLMQMMRESLGPSVQNKSLPVFETVEEVVHFFEERKSRLRNSRVPPDTLETVELDLEEEQRKAMHELLKRQLSQP